MELNDGEEGVLAKFIVHSDDVGLSCDEGAKEISQSVGRHGNEVNFPLVISEKEEEEKDSFAEQRSVHLFFMIVS
jgi:hypothetical protein